MTFLQMSSTQHQRGHPGGHLSSTRIKSKYYSGDHDDSDLRDDLGATERNEIGMIRAVCVQVRNVFCTIFYF